MANANEHPLKMLGIVLFSIVPHTAEVERLFSQLGNTQSAKRCNLTMENFRALGKLRSNYSAEIYARDRADGKPTHRKHAHMHAREEAVIDTDLVDSLEATFTWAPPLHDLIQESEAHLGFEDMTEAELDAAYGDVAHEGATMADPNGEEVLEGRIYSFAELANVEKGVAPVPYSEEIVITNVGEGAQHEVWSVEELLQ